LFVAWNSGDYAGSAQVFTTPSEGGQWTLQQTINNSVRFGYFGSAAVIGDTFAAISANGGGGGSRVSVLMVRIVVKSFFRSITGGSANLLYYCPWKLGEDADTSRL
jgi:hypothetical protein